MLMSSYADVDELLVHPLGLFQKTLLSLPRDHYLFCRYIGFIYLLVFITSLLPLVFMVWPTDLTICRISISYISNAASDRHVTDTMPCISINPLHCCEVHILWCYNPDMTWTKQAGEQERGEVLITFHTAQYITVQSISV